MQGHVQEGAAASVLKMFTKETHLHSQKGHHPPKKGPQPNLRAIFKISQNMGPVGVKELKYWNQLISTVTWPLISRVSYRV